jgi:hypothetical protein
VFVKRLVTSVDAHFVTNLQRESIMPDKVLAGGRVQAADMK